MHRTLVGLICFFVDTHNFKFAYFMSHLHRQDKESLMSDQGVCNKVVFVFSLETKLCTTTTKGVKKFVF